MVTAAFPRPVQLQLDETRYWEGLGRQGMDFPQVLGELIDNGISATGKDADGDPLPFVIEVSLKRSGDTVAVKVCDQGIGMTLDELAEHVLSPGGKGRSSGPLNEHGFGLKNALCILTEGNRRPFRIQTRDEVAVQHGHVYLVNGPFSFTMQVDNGDPAHWNDDVSHSTASRGTRIHAETSFEFLRTTYKRASVLQTLMDRLGEHLGVMYRGYLKEPANKLWLRWAEQGADGSFAWQEHRIRSVDVPYAPQGIREELFDLVIGGVKARAVYREGNLDFGAGQDGARGWPYPLKVFYQRNLQTQGLDLVVRGRVVKMAQLPEIWPEAQRHNDFNEYVGEIILDENFRTVNNKTGLDPHNPFWVALIEMLEAERVAGNLGPTRKTTQMVEWDIKNRLKTVLEGAFTGSSVQLDRPVWSGTAVEIDLYHDIPGQSPVIYEVKRGTSGPLDVYQLLMYWDGVVRDDKQSPSLGRLVAADHPDSVKNIVDEINKRNDSLGNPYRLELKRISELGIEH